MRLRHRVVRVVLLTALGCLMANGVARAQESIAFDLPEQSLEESLRALSKRSNVSILIDRRLVSGLRAPALKSTSTVDQALSWLLRGTGLAHEFVDEHTIVLTTSATNGVDDAERTPVGTQGGGADPASRTDAAATGTGMAARGSTDGMAEIRVVDAITVTASKLRPLDQVAVTGSRLALTQRETPATLDVVDSDQITARGLHSVKMAVDTLPGVSTGGSPGDPAELSMRGFTGGQVMVLFDGIHIGPSVVVNRPGNSFNLEKVEVLKGPASVLYGQGAIGGVVNTVSKMPRFDRGGLDVLTTYGSRGRVNIGIGAGVVLSEDVALRADIARTSSDGFVKGLPEDALDIAASLRWRPNDDLDVILKMDYLDDDPSPYFGTPLIPASAAHEPLDVVTSSRGFAIDRRMRDVSYNVADYRVEAQQFWPKLLVTWSPRENLTLKGQAYYFHAERTWMNAETYAYNPSTGLIDRDRFMVTHDQDLTGAQLSASHEASLFGKHNRLLIGVESTDFEFQRRRGVVPTDSVDPFDPEPGVFGSVATRSLPTYWQTWAVFAEDRLALSPRLNLVSGLRYDSFALDRQNLTVDGAIDTQTSFQRTYTSITGRLGLVYDFSPQLTSYASYSMGADPPVPVSLLSLSAREKDFDFADSYQVEIGLKGNTPRNIADFTVSAYYIRRKNILTLLASSTIANIASQSSRGIEATANVKLTSNWTVSANAAYTRSRYDDFMDPSAGNVSGNSAPNVPEWLGNVWVSARNIAGLPLELGGGIRYLGDRYGDNANTLVLNDFTLVTVYATWGVSERVLVAARVKNVFDEAYANWADIFYPNQIILGEPRSFEIELVARF